MSQTDVILDMSYHTIMSGSFHDLRQAGILAVIHKAGAGLDTPDPAYLDKRDQAMEAGILWGAYHVGIKTCNGREQADDFLGRVRAGSPKGRTLLALDFERDEKNFLKTMPPEQAEEFVTCIKDQVGFYPVVYGRGTLMRAVEDNPDSALAKCDLWLAHYGQDQPTPPPGWERWTFWQYTEQGHVGEVITHCSRDRFNGTQQELMDYWRTRSI